jgi:hypothetical protein
LETKSRVVCVIPKQYSASGTARPEPKSEAMELQIREHQYVIAGRGVCGKRHANGLCRAAANKRRRPRQRGTGR